MILYTPVEPKGLGVRVRAVDLRALAQGFLLRMRRSCFV